MSETTDLPVRRVVLTGKEPVHLVFDLENLVGVSLDMATILRLRGISSGVVVLFEKPGEQLLQHGVFTDITSLQVDRDRPLRDKSFGVKANSGEEIRIYGSAIKFVFLGFPFGPEKEETEVAQDAKKINLDDSPRDDMPVDNLQGVPEEL